MQEQDLHEIIIIRLVNVTSYHEKKFPLKLKATVYKCYVRPAIMYGSELCGQREN